jgi:hypothetical protein
VHVALHLAERAFALHLLFQRLEGLIDVVVADENLNQGYLSCCALEPPGPLVPIFRGGGERTMDLDKCFAPAGAKPPG